MGEMSKDYGLMRKFNDHIAAFSIVDSPELSIFREYLSKIDSGYLECSCKVDILKFQVDPIRFNIWFKDMNRFRDNLFGIINIFRQYSGIGFKIDQSALKEIIYGTDMSKVKELIFGIDMRSDRKESRLKLWFIIEDYPEKVSQLIARYPEKTKQIMEPLCKDRKLLYGYDFGYSGKVELKSYPLLYPEDLEGIGKNIISEKSLELLSLSRSFHITFKDKTEDRVFHIRPKSPINFMNYLGIDVLNAIFLKLPVHDPSAFIISIDDSEISSGKISHFNLYY